MSLPKFHLNHKPENKNALSLGERRQLHNIIIGVLASLSELSPGWMYENTQITANEFNAGVTSGHDEFIFVVYADDPDKEEDEVTATLKIDIDDENNTLTTTTEYKDGREGRTTVETAWYRDESRNSDRATTVEKTILPLAAFADEFVRNVIPKGTEISDNSDELEYLAEDFQA